MPYLRHQLLSRYLKGKDWRGVGLESWYEKETGESQCVFDPQALREKVTRSLRMKV